MQHCVAHLRSFLRFSHSQGLVDRRLDAIDTPRVYRDELPPRALPWEVVQQLLRSIDRGDAMGWRDYTVGPAKRRKPAPAFDFRSIEGGSNSQKLL